MKDNKVKLVVFDWAGTTVDYGCMAPYVVFDRVFTDKGIKLTKEEIPVSYTHLDVYKRQANGVPKGAPFFYGKVKTYIRIGYLLLPVSKV